MTRRQDEAMVRSLAGLNAPEECIQDWQVYLAPPRVKLLLEHEEFTTRVAKVSFCYGWAMCRNRMKVVLDRAEAKPKRITKSEKAELVKLREQVESYKQYEMMVNKAILENGFYKP